MFKVITGTLQANHISMQLTDDTINDDSIFEVYTDTENAIPSSVTVGNHTVTITFDSKPNTNVGVKVLVNNIVGEYLPEVSASDVTYNDSTVDETLDNISEDISNISTTIDERVPDDTILGGVLYHTTTGNTWKKLDASNLDYDADSTIYSAMGDIDTLETDSKNLVGAINEINSKPPESSTKFNNYCNSINDILTLIPNIYDSTQVIVSSNVSALLTKGDNTMSIGKLNVYRLSDTIFDYYGAVGDSVLYVGRYNNGSYICKKITGTTV